MIDDVLLIINIKQQLSCRSRGNINIYVAIKGLRSRDRDIIAEKREMSRSIEGTEEPGE